MYSLRSGMSVAVLDIKQAEQRRGVLRFCRVVEQPAGITAEKPRRSAQHSNQCTMAHLVSVGVVADPPALRREKP